MKIMTREIARQFHLRECAFFILIQYVIIQFFVALNNPALVRVLSNLLYCSLLSLLTFCALFCVWASLIVSFAKSAYARDYALISLSPLLFLLFWNSHDGRLSIITPFAIVGITIFCLCAFLVNKKDFLPAMENHHKTFVALFSVIYCIVLSFVVIRQYNNFSTFNPEDFANYNQIFWNTIRGDIFETSLYGNNFASHNSPIYFLFVPFYAAVPHPLTLMMIKTVLLSLCIVPLYCIAKHIFLDKTFFLLVCAFLLYPYFISQHFSPPHEICFIPFFLLWAYYFYMKKRFTGFLIFLVFSLSTKEHIALVAVMFGIYALCTKRSIRWIVTPIVLGIVWGVASLLIIDHFQKTYHFYDPWLLSHVKQNFLYHNNGNIVTMLIRGFSSSNIANISSLTLASPLLCAIGMLPPLLSPVGILGLPEFALNLIADRPDVLSPARHYNIVVSCFLLIATVEGIKKIAHFQWFRNRDLHPRSSVIVLSILILSLTLMYSHTWLWLTSSHTSKEYVATIKEALTHIPPDAYVSVPKNIAVHVSGRTNYFFHGQIQYIKNKKRQDPSYILTDGNQESYLVSYNLSRNYRLVFDKENIKVFKKVGKI